MYCCTSALPNSYAFDEMPHAYTHLLDTAPYFGTNVLIAGPVGYLLLPSPAHHLVLYFGA